MRVDSLPVLGLAAVVGGGLLMWSSRRKRRSVVITGGCGNLGVKLATHLLATPDPPRVILIEHPEFYNASRVPTGAEVVLGDLIDSALAEGFGLLNVRLVEVSLESQI